MNATNRGRKWTEGDGNGEMRPKLPMPIPQICVVIYGTPPRGIKGCLATHALQHDLSFRSE